MRVVADLRKKKYCRNALTALRYAFILKKKTGRRIAQDAFDSMMKEIGNRKSQTSKQEKP